jgi:hypothetical protein
MSEPFNAVKKLLSVFATLYECALIVVINNLELGKSKVVSIKSTLKST